MFYRIKRWFMSLLKRNPVGHNHDVIEVPTPSNPSEVTFGNIDIEIHGLKNFSPKQQAKFREACEKGKKVLNSQQFKDAVLSANLTETNGLTNMQIYELICSGKDLYNEEDDKDIDVFTTLYTKNFSSTVGYTYPSTWKTWINSKFFNRFNIWEVFGNVFHEALHNFGFKHLKVKATSVPYVLGYLVRDLLKKSEKGLITLTPVQ